MRLLSTLRRWGERLDEAAGAPRTPSNFDLSDREHRSIVTGALAVTGAALAENIWHGAVFAENPVASPDPAPAVLPGLSPETTQRSYRR